MSNFHSAKYFTAYSNYSDNAFKRTFGRRNNGLAVALVRIERVAGNDSSVSGKEKKKREGSTRFKLE